MPKLPVLTPRKLLQIIEQHGFILDHTTGGHYILYNRETKRRVTIPFHAKDIPKGTLLSILRESGLSKDDLK